MDLRFRPDLEPGNKRFLPGALKNQAKSKSKSWLSNPHDTNRGRVLIYCIRRTQRSGGISTAASVADDAATPDLTRPQTSTGVGVSRLTPLAVSPQVSVAPAPRAPCATTPEPVLLAYRWPVSAHGCERKEAPKIDLKPHRFFMSPRGTVLSHKQKSTLRAQKITMLRFYRESPRGGATS